MRKQKGFSLIELLIVLAIILIIASIAIPSLISVKRRGNETSAVASLRTINTAQISYGSTYPKVGFAASLAVLGGRSCSPPSSSSACLIDTQIASGTKNGYTFALAGTGAAPLANYQVIASPAAPNETGVHYYCSFDDGVIRMADAPIAHCDTSVAPLE